MELHNTVSREPIRFNSLPLRSFQHRAIPSRPRSQLVDSPCYYHHRPPTWRTDQTRENLHWNIFSCVWNLHVCMGQVEIILVQMKSFLFASNQ